jgi:guanylate kinase
MTTENTRSGDSTGRLFIVSAPSGAGKSTLCHLLLERLPGLHYSVSTTTRPPRDGEIEGHDYFFTDVDSFKSGIANHQWAEWAEVHGHYYGTSAAFIDAQLAAGHDLLLDIDVQGAAQLRAQYPDAVTIFIMPPSMAVLRQRLKKRRADAPEVIAKRLANARREMEQHTDYQYTIVNDRLDEALTDLLGIVGLPAVGGDGGDRPSGR